MSPDPTDENGLPLWPAAERNKQPIAEVLATVLPERGLLLEVASGTGQHAAHFVHTLPGWTIQPSDCDPENLTTLTKRVALVENARLLPPIELDVTAVPRAGVAATIEPNAIFCANMLHIAPWAACLGLFALAGRWLHAGEPLVTYGPYSLHGEHTAESNARFDQSLRERNLEWGVRDVDALTEVARAESLTLAATHTMPANNLILVWRRR